MADVIALAVGVVFSKVRFTTLIRNIPVIPLLNKELSLNAPVLINKLFDKIILVLQNMVKVTDMFAKSW